MCIIFGAKSKKGQDVSEPVLRMIRSIVSDFPKSKSMFVHLQDTALKLDLSERKDRIQLPESTTVSGVVCLITDDQNCYVVQESESSSVSLIGKIFNLTNAPSSIMESFARISNSVDDFEKSSRLLLESLDGQYAFALRRENLLLLARDPIGTKPLYVGENNRLIAFSSRCRPLWEIGIKDCKMLGQPILVHDGRSERVRSGIWLESKRKDRAELVDSLITKLSQAIKKMASPSGNRINILFSGGLDSSVIAKLSKDLGIRPTLLCAGTPLSRDIINARRMSSALDLPLIEKEISPEDITDSLFQVIRTIESAEMIPVSTSLPFHFALEMCADRGEKGTVLHGQGADELFCGYKRYETTLSDKGYKALCSEMLRDVVRLGEAIPLYDKMGTATGKELFAPFAELSVVGFSLGVPIQLKLSEESSEFIRKRILRELANKIGVPMRLLPKEKVAAQFGSGAAKIMDKAARRAGFTRDVAKRKGFPLPIQAYLKEISQSLRFP
jgi:asparagine synthase (glutamine-hydrolysing)